MQFIESPWALPFFPLTGNYYSLLKASLQTSSYYYCKLWLCGFMLRLDMRKGITVRRGMWITISRQKGMDGKNKQLYLNCSSQLKTINAHYETTLNSILIWVPASDTQSNSNNFFFTFFALHSRTVAISPQSIPFHSFRHSICTHFHAASLIHALTALTI